MKTIAIAAAFVAATLAAAPAFAQPASAPRIAVSVADLDLSTADGRAALDLRLLHAARTACGTASPADLQGAASLERCVADARAAAASQRDAAIALASRPAGTVLAASR